MFSAVSPIRRLIASLGISALAFPTTSGADLAAQAAVTAPVVAQSVAVPTYFTSSTTWARLRSAAPAVGMVVINPSNGAGSSKQQTYVSRVSQAHASGIKVLGYVYSGYATRSTRTLRTQIENYFKWYSVDGIFVDEVSTSCADLAYYQTLADAVKSRSGARFVLNPGTNTAECFVNVADVIVNFEDTYANYVNWQPSGWAGNYPANRFWHLVYNTARGSLSAALALSQQRRAGFVYVTSDTTPNPWDTLPAADYWAAESAGVAAGTVADPVPSSSASSPTSPAPSVTAQPSISPSSVVTQTPTRTPSAPSPSVTPTLSGSTTPAPTASPTATPTGTPTATPTATPTVSPTATPPTAGAAWWAPTKGTDWQWQLSGTMDTSVASPVFDIDGEDATMSLVAALHAKGARVICYFSAGSWENWRADAGNFPASVQGKTLSGWPDEKWLDVRNTAVLLPLMDKRIQMCKSKGFDAVEPDNVDGFSNATGFAITAADQLTYNRALAELAHKYGLGIAQKNDPDQATALQPSMDFAVVEECAAYGECAAYTAYTKAGKAVLHVEYSGSLSSFCPSTKALGFSSMLKKLDLDSWRSVCP